MAVSTMTSARMEFLAGVKAELPLLIGVIPFGMIYGVLALSAGIPPVEAQAMSAIIFAGSSQFVAAQLIAVGAPAMVIVLSAGIVNLRHTLYSASLAPYFKKLGLHWKWLLPYLLTDEAYAVTITNYQQRPTAQAQETSASLPVLARPYQHWYFLGAGLTLWTSWQASTAMGIFLGTQVPASWSLDFSLALTFIALVVPALKDRPSVAAALSAGVAALLANGLPYRLGLVVASLVGILIGLWVERQ